ncbi:MAG: M42 family peptidase, partial [Caldisericia bacterium]|nr:M42 family peptidase [Caldisericia bacterium]
MVLKELSELNGTSGHEEKVRKFLKDNLEKLVDEVIVDSIGNLILLKKGVSSSKRIMFAAHMDEVALMVTKIEKNGFIKFATVGGIEPSVLPAQTVVIESSENIFGVIGVRPIHVQRSEEFDTPIKKENL